MPDYIDRDKLPVNQIPIGGPMMPRIISVVYADDIAAAPAADVVEVVHGKWIKKHKHVGGFRRYTGVDDMGEQHTITVDERAEFDDRYCSECGKQSADNFLSYCPNCGARMDMEE